MFSFAHEYSGLDCLRCLRDIECSILYTLPKIPNDQDPVRMDPVEIDFDIREKTKLILPNWCNSCKIQRCFRLGAKPTR